MLMTNMSDDEHPLSQPIETPDPRPRRPKRPTRAPPPPPDDSPRDSLPQTPAPSDLTPLRAHYLKKSLVQLQFGHEMNAITTTYPTNISTLSFLGHPFSPPPRDVNPFLDLPFLRYIFRQFVLTFPFMAAAPKDFYSEKLQPFVTSALSRNLSPTSVLDDDGNSDTTSDQASRKKLFRKVERNLSLFLSSATKLLEREEVVRLNQADLDRLEALAHKRIASGGKAKNVFQVNVVGVRTVVNKGRMRSRVHDEFIVRTRRSGVADFYVARRYGDFRTLAHELQKAHPDEQIPPPPAKDRTAVVTSPVTSPVYTFDNHSSSEQGSSDALPYQNSRLEREKNRLTLRSYLYTLLSSDVAWSPVLKSFLLSGPIIPTHEELEDMWKREEADKIREDGRRKFAKEISNRVNGLRDAVRSVKGDIMGKDGLTHIFATIKVTPDIRDLPPNYQAIREWARISLASTVFRQFVASDNSSESFASLKRIHGLMPYFMLKTILRISNPIAMIRGVLDLFLAQPFGGRSLLQRMFTSSLTEEVRVLESQIEAVKAKVDDPIISAKIRQFVYAPREIQDMYKADAAAEHMDLLVVVLRAPDEPILSRMQMHRLAKAHRAHKEYLKQRASQEDSDDDDGPQNEDAWLLEDLKVLTQLYSKLRDREQLIALIFEGSTAELLKDMITIFYTPLAQVYRAASIADSLGDLQNFINDLIKTVEQVEEGSQEDVHHTVQAFIDLVERHEQSFYHFVHKVHSKGENLFNGLMHWVELFLTVVREGLSSLISLEYLLPHTGKERDEIMAEVDRVALHHYKLKVAYETKIRRRFRRMQAMGSDADAEDEATQALVNGIVGEIDFGELVQGGAGDLAAEETDDESDQDDDDESESSTTEDSDSDESDEESSSGENQNAPRDVGPFRSSPSTSRQPTTRPTLVLSPREEFPQLARPHSNHGFRSPPRTPRSATGDMSSKPLPPSPRSHPIDESQGSPRLTRHGTVSSTHDRTPSKEGYHPLDRLRNESVHHKVASDPGLVKSPSRLSHSSSNTHDDPPPEQKHGKKRATAQASQPPELKHIPKLLPVFVELMRPLLQPRKIDGTG